MMSHVTNIREFVELVMIAEQVRSRTFNMQEFKRIQDLRRMHEYADEHLERLGRGCGRTTYLLNSGKIIKIANVEGMSDGCGPREGFEQNQAEQALSQQPTISSIVAKVFEHERTFAWIVAELVRPIKSKQEFEHLLGANVGPDELVEIAWFSNVHQLKRTVDKHGLTSQHARDLIAGLRSMKERSVNMFDLQRRDHWGKTNDGRLVLLDYGLIDPDYTNE